MLHVFELRSTRLYNVRLPEISQNKIYRLAENGKAIPVYVDEANGNNSNSGFAYNKAVADWFKAQFPDYKTAPMLKDGHLAVVPVNAPEIKEYKQKIAKAG